MLTSSLDATLGVLTGATGRLAAGFLVAVDVADLSRVRVSKRGCCRDESRLSSAAAPSWVHDGPATLTALGAVAATSLLVTLVASLVSVILGVAAMQSVGLSPPRQPEIGSWGPIPPPLSSAMVTGPPVVMTFAGPLFALLALAVGAWVVVDAPSRLTEDP